MKRHYWPLLAIFALAGLAGCNDSDGTTVEKPIDNELTYDSTMEDLQSSGDLPTLDVTTTILGDDSDGDGVRDDIQNYIENLDQTEADKVALLSFAKSVQSTMAVDTSNEQEVSEAVEGSLMQVSCLIYQFDDGQEAYSLVKQITAFTRNTQIRHEQGLALDNAYNGSVYRLPSTEDCQ